MDRKHFLTATSAIAAMIAAAGAAIASTPTPDATPVPSAPFPSRSPRPGSPSPSLHGHLHRAGATQASDLEHIHRRLERLIDMLEGDPGDYGGHRSGAIGYLQQADNEIVAAMAQATSSPYQSL
jgi:hypothetical protein